MPNLPKGPEIKSALIQAAPLFTAMAAGYSSGRGPYAYLDQGIATIQQRQKEMREEEAKRAANAAFRGAIMPGGLAPMGAPIGAYTGSNAAPAPLRANPGVIGGGQAGVSGAFPAADPGVIGARGGNTFAPQTGMTGFKALEAQYGLPEGYLERTAQIESGGNPNAQNPNSSAGGLFQFIDSTAQQYGLTDRFNPEQAAMAAARLAADNKAILTRTLGREPTAAELYLAHQQGAGGAARLLANPNARAVDIVGADAVRLNGGNENMTAGEFASKWTGKFGGQPTQTDPMQDPEVMRLMEVFATPGLTPEQRQVVQMRLETRMAQLQPKAPEIREVDGRLVAVQGTDVREIYAPAQEQGARPLTMAERAQWGIPADDNRPYAIEPGKKPELIGGTGVTVQNNMGGNAFDSEFAKLDAKSLATINDAGAAATRNIGVIDRLDALLAATPQGAEGGFVSIAGRLGINLGDATSDVQAAEAIINTLVPRQREPGSGPMSDRDVQLFKESLPRIINQPGGNQKIIATMRAIAEYDAAGAQIVQELRSGVIDRATAFSKLQSRPNPLADLNATQGTTAAPAPVVIDGYTIEAVE